MNARAHWSLWLQRGLLWGVLGLFALWFLMPLYATLVSKVM